LVLRDRCEACSLVNLPRGRHLWNTLRARRVGAKCCLNVAVYFTLYDPVYLLTAMPGIMNLR
jgi:hypothetical protein